MSLSDQDECHMNRRLIEIACGTTPLIAAAVAVVVASRNRRQPAPPPEVPVAALPSEVRVKAVERNPAAQSRRACRAD